MRKKRMLKPLKCLAFIFLCLLPFAVNGQNRTVSVSGTVTDSKREPLIGVTIQVQGTTHGTLTDIDGKFAIPNVPSQSKVVVSYVGMQTQTIDVQGRTSINIVLKENTESLSEVVVVGYGTQKKASVTGSVSTANMADVKKSSDANLDVALAGRIPGLISTQSDGGQPGQDAGYLYLRGVATMNGNNPLILVDGVSFDNFRSNILAEIDPNEVESISVLKDASATAVFGIKGANGVIIVTTKRGKSGKTNLSMNVTQSYTSFEKVDKRLHSWDFMTLRNQALANDGQPAEYSEDVIAKFKNPLWGLNTSDPDYAQKVEARNYLYCDHYYMDEFFKKSTPQTKADMNISGGNDKFTFFLNAGYIHQGGNLKVEPESQLGYNSACEMNRENFRSNMDYKFSNSLKAQLNLGTTLQTTNMPAVAGLYGSQYHMITDLFYNAQIMLPNQAGPVTLPGYGVPAGLVVRPSNMDRSPFQVMNRRGFRNYTEANISSQLALEWDLSELITSGLTLKGMVSYNSSGYTISEGWKNETSCEIIPNYDNGTFSYSLPSTSPGTLSMSRGYDALYSVNAQASLNYHRNFGKKHDVGGMFVAQRDYRESGANIPWNVIGIAARATYAYDARYLLEYDMCYNGSEQFAPVKRFGFFPAVSLGYVISNEKFMRHFNWLDNLKLRYSNGMVGNDQIDGRRFLYQDNIQISKGSYVGGLGTPAIRSVDQGLLGNKTITWELAHKQNWGVDFGIFKELSLSADYFTEDRTQILIGRQSIPAFQGVDLGNIPRANMGKMSNKGIDFELTYNKNITKDWHIQLKGNYSTNKNTVTFNDEPIRTEDYATRYEQQGLSLYQCLGYKIDWADHGGYWVSKDQIKASGVNYSFGTPRPGDFKYVDINHDGTIDDRDKVPIKYSPIPGISYGFGLNTNFKGFDLSVFFQGLAHYSMAYGGQGVYENIMHGYYFNYQRTAWTEDRYLKGEKITYPALTATHSTSQQPNDFFIQDRSFLRLKNIEFGYTLPQKTLSFMGVTSCRLFVGGQNLFTWDHLHTDHLDPEQGNPYGYPMTKMVNFGLNVNF